MGDPKVAARMGGSGERSFPSRLSPFSPGRVRYFWMGEQPSERVLSEKEWEEEDRVRWPTHSLPLSLPHSAGKSSHGPYGNWARRRREERGGTNDFLTRQVVVVK